MSKIDELCMRINKEWKEQIMSRGELPEQLPKIPFTSMFLNYCTYGGIPRNRIIEFAGDTGSGKTSTALDICKNAYEIFHKEFEQELDGADTTQRKLLEARGAKQILYVDCENTLNKAWAKNLGVPIDDIIILRPQTQVAEAVFQIIREAIETNEIGLVILDSIGVMVSQQAYDKEIIEKTYGGISKPLTLFSQELVLLCNKYQCTFIGINQLREDMSGYNRKITTGGKAWKHCTSVRIFFEKSTNVDACGNKIKQSSDCPMGNMVAFNIVKTKVFKGDRRLGYYTLMYDTGIDEVINIVEIAVQKNIIEKAGPWFTIHDPITGECFLDDTGKVLKLQGQSAVIAYLRKNKEVFDKIHSMLLEMMS